MDIQKFFATNKQKETDGVWVEGPDGAQFLVARVGNKAQKDLAEKLFRPHRQAMRKGMLEDSVQNAITYKVMARTILLDWKGVKDNGQDIPYTPDTAEEYFKNYPDLAEFISDYATQLKLYQDDAQKEQEKN